MLITADHGNIEQMVYPLTGELETKHNVSPVPVYLVGHEYLRERSDAQIDESEKRTMGIISDVAPTILQLLEIPKPTEMSGESLLSLLTYC
jgi:2,3-bisphosphoglycerate-independent phosphoglycerate mutase